MNKEIKIITDKQRIRPQESEVNRLFSDNSFAEKTIKWTPKFKGEEGFAAGLKKTIDWFSNTENRKNYKSTIYNQ